MNYGGENAIVSFAHNLHWIIAFTYKKGHLRVQMAFYCMIKKIKNQLFSP